MNKRIVLSFLDGKNRFNYRAAALIVRNQHVLICRENDDNYVMLPGGRVEMGEASNVALAREIEEELRCAGDVGQLLFSVENFFDRAGEQFHEIGIYYRVTLPPDFPFVTDGPCLVTHDEGFELTFSWVPINSVALKKINLLPHWIQARLEDLPNQTEHLIVDER